MKPALLLFPNLLGDHPHHEPFLPPSIDRAVGTIDGLIAESDRAGRRFLGRFQTKKPAMEIPIAVYDEADVDFMLEPIKRGERWGFVSDCGLPCVADPGWKLIRRARETGIKVQSYVGPSSIMLALMQSGLPGQRFMFHGYLAKDREVRAEEIKRIQKRAIADEATQIFIEAPYRNQHMLETLLEILDDDMWLCVAWELTMPDQGIVSQPVRLWRKMPLPAIEKKPAIFLVGKTI